MGMQNKAFGDLVTFTRASGATRFNALGQLEVVGTNVPRIDYDPVTGACKGLLIEEQRTNLLPNQQSFTSGGGCTFSTDGTTLLGIPATLCTTTGTTNSLAAPVGHSNSFSAGTTCTRSFLAKAGTSSTLMVERNDGGLYGAVVFNLGSGTVTNASGITGTMLNLGDGVWYCAATYTTVNSGSLANWYIHTYGTAPAGMSVYIAAIQHEVGAFPTSYIPTTGAAATRAVDVASINTLSPWYNPAEGTLYAEYDADFAQTNIAASLGAGSIECVAIRQRGNPDVIGMVRKGGSGFDVGPTAIVIGTTVKAAIRYANGAPASVSVNGNSIKVGSTAPTDLTSAFTRLGIGKHASPGADGTLNGHIRAIRYTPKRLTDAQLQAMTA